MRRALEWAVLLSAIWPLGQVRAGRITVEPITLRIEGFVGPLPKGVVPQATWVLRVEDQKATLRVTRLEVLTGDTAYFDIIAALEPYPYAFTVYGDGPALDALTRAGPGQMISLIATAQLAQLPGLLFISSIEAVTAATPEATPAATPAPGS